MPAPEIECASSISQKHSIIEHMKQILGMYHMTKIAQKRDNWLARRIDVELDVAEFKGASKSITGIKKRYIKRHPFTPKYKVNIIMSDAIKMGYLEKDGNKEDFGGGSVYVTTEGRELLDKALFLPVGLWRAWFNWYGQLLTGLIIGIVIPSVVYLVKHHNHLW